MEKYSIHLYPAELQLIQGGHSNARMTIPAPSMLPWWELWVSVGASLYALSLAYDTAKGFLGLRETSCPDYPWSDYSHSGEWQYGSFTRDKETGRIYFLPLPPPHIIGGASSEGDSQGDDLRIVRLHYNSPIDIDMIVGFATAFSLVSAVVTGAITTVVKLLEWGEKKKEREDEDLRRHLEIERLRLELQQKKAEISQPAETPKLSETLDLTKPQMVLVEQLFFYGNVLAGKEEIWIDPSLR